MYCVMASIDNIVSKNVGNLDKSFLVGVSKKNAKRLNFDRKGYSCGNSSWLI